MAQEKRALRLNAGQFTRLIKITRATSRYADRDVLVLMLGHHCGLRVTEISRITVADVMLASGKLRQEVSLREAVTKGCRQRCTYLQSGSDRRSGELSGLPAGPWHRHRAGRHQVSRSVAAPAADLLGPWGSTQPEHQAAHAGDRRAARLSRM